MKKLTFFTLIMIICTLALALFSTADTIYPQDEICLLDSNFTECMTRTVTDLCNEIITISNDSNNPAQVLFPEVYRYDSLTDQCYIVEETTENITNTSTTNDNTNITLNDQWSLTISERVNKLENVAEAIQLKINQIDANQIQYNIELSNLNQQLIIVNQKLVQIENEFSQDVNSFSTGLAGLQTGLSETDLKVENLGDGLAKEQSFTKFIIYLFFILLVITVGLIVVFYINKRNKNYVHPKANEYITKQIQAGKKFPEIRASLLTSGWSEEDIKNAYKATIKSNYDRYIKSTSNFKTNNEKNRQNYSKKNLTSSTTKINLGNSNKKVLGIFLVCIFLILGIILFVKGGSTGQAYQILFNPENSEFLGFNCTDQHILNADKDGCCLDIDPKDGVCDIVGDYEQEPIGFIEDNSVCTDNKQCSSNQFCIDGQCGDLSRYYPESECTRKCVFRSIKVLTSDGETYDVKPGSGSYTLAGALEWKILPTKSFCADEERPVTFKITKKSPGKILSEEMILLDEGDSSNEITHPELSGSSFYLKVKDVSVACR